jgi:hypothetical protein
LLVDANLLILYTVGSVSPNRIASFKRTRRYEIRDFDLLTATLANFPELYTTPHVLAEVSNLINLAGDEGEKARWVLKETLGWGMTAGAG